jgi:formate dehydrogenase subunit beta
MVDNKKLKDEIQKLLKQDNIKYVICYKKGTYGFQTTPYFISKNDNIDDIIFSPLCANNLSSYIKFEEGNKKIGVVVKGCDSRALVQMLNEKRLPREMLVIIGVPCNGTIDFKKLRNNIYEPLENVDVSEEKDNFVFKYNNNKKMIPKKEILFDKCLHCEYPTPLDYDILIGEKIKPLGKEDYKNIKDFEKKKLDEKWKFWEEQFSRCIRCYACRNFCPVCYCDECMAAQLDPQWLCRSVNLSENAAWHIIRSFHLAGRCTSCGECERVCPMNIPLMLLNKKMEKEIKELFDYVAGIKLDEKPLLAIFKPNDPEEDIK